MIKINRPNCPDIFQIGNTPESIGEQETRDCILFFTDAANHQVPYKKTGSSGLRIKESYTVYKEARKILNKAFHGKCAFCESKITSIYNGDVEHFRPKAAYHSDPSQVLIKPGYYWLASAWDNLLFACPFCNQTNTHEISDNGDVKEVVLGKLNQFPLVTESFRLNHSHGTLYLADRAAYDAAFKHEESERLLLEPCVDENIEQFFEYHDDGAIVTSPRLNAFERKKAETSIKVFALHRLGLVQARKEKIIQVRAQIRRVEIAIKNFNKYMDKSDEERVWFEALMREEMKALKKFTDPDQEYCGLSRYIISDYFKKAGLV